MVVANLKGVSSMKLHRDLGITQRSAWFMLHRIRKAMDNGGQAFPFSGAFEVDEMSVGGLEKNKYASKRQQQGRGTVGKTPTKWPPPARRRDRTRSRSHRRLWGSAS